MMGQIMASYYVHFVYKVNIMVIHKKECQGCFFQKEVHVVFFDTKRKNTVVWSFSITYHNFLYRNHTKIVLLSKTNFT